MSLETDVRPFSHHQKAALIMANQFDNRIYEAGRQTEVSVLVYESVLPEGELLSFAEIADRVAPGNKESYRVKQHAIQEIIKRELPDDLRRDLVSIRQGAFALRTFARMNPDVLAANRLRGAIKGNESRKSRTHPISQAA